MPTISIVDGVKIQIFYNDHNPPHFHAVLAEDEVLVVINSLELIRGSLPAAKLRRILDWAAEHQAALALSWVKCQDGEAPEEIA